MSSVTLIVLGGAGDLAMRLLLPGLGQFMALAPEYDVTLVGAGLEEPDDYQGEVAAAVKAIESPASVPDDVVERLVSKTSWVTTDATSPDDLSALLSQREGRTLLYFALSPGITKLTVDALTKAELPSNLEFVLEKPFGTDAQTARTLTKTLHRFTDEDHITRTDHFLGMSGTINLNGLLLTNRPLEATWSNEAVESITFVFDETLGLEGRAKFYDATGAAKDMLQSHLIQVMARSLAETADGAQGAANVLAATSLAKEVSESVHRARYTAGDVAGKHLPDYTSEDGVDPSRGTETLAQVTLAVDTDAWRGIPIILRSGKGIGNPRKEITIRYRPVGDADGTTLRLAFEDDEVFMEINVTDPGHRESLQRVTFHTRLAPSRVSAYGRVVRALMHGTGATKLHAESPARAWEILQPVFDAFNDGTVPLEEYAAGSSGPKDW